MTRVRKIVMRSDAPGMAGLPARRRVGLLLVLVLVLGAVVAGATHEGWLDELLAWRSQREQRLRDPQGYLGLAGLHWLQPGDNAFGAGQDLAVPLPAAEGVPARAGVLRWHDGQVQLIPADGSALSLDGQPLRADASGPIVLRSDAEGEATRVGLGRLSFWIVDRAGALGVRVNDPQHELLARFAGCRWYEPDASWCVRAAYRPLPAPRPVAVPNILGTRFDEQVPGVLVFERAGVAYELHPTGSDAAHLGLMFGDLTNGAETYGGGRFLPVPAPDEQGFVLLDFNRAYNPPCAFTPYTTCPMPLPENRLAVAVQAGERLPPETGPDDEGHDGDDGTTHDAAHVSGPGTGEH